MTKNDTNPRTRFSPRPLRRARAAAAVIGGLLATTALADPIPVPNGDFSDPANDGTIGGLIGPNIVNQPIGEGPWHGTANGILGLLAQPTLTIDSEAQAATISGLLGINVAGLINNGGEFRQQLSENYQNGLFYVLRAEVDTGPDLTLGLLAEANVGIRLLANNVELVSSTTADPTLVTLGGAGATEEIRLGYWADIAASGPIQVSLFNMPQNLLTASLLETVTFSNVRLEGRDVGPPAGIDPIDDDDDPNETPINTPYPGEYSIIVRDDEGDGIPGFSVIISAPLEGASADLSSPTSDDPPGRVIEAVSDIDGVVSFDAVANEIAGCFRVTIQPSDPEVSISNATFYFRNISDDPTQSSIFCNSFER